MKRIDVAVVGAGVVGLSTAWWLARGGRSVSLFERFSIGHGRGSSHGATRIFRYAYDDPVYVQLAQQAAPAWRELEIQTGERILEITGGFDVGDPAYLERSEAAMRLCGAHAKPLSAGERRELFPWFGGKDEPALFSPDTGVLAADVALRALAKAARNSGSVLHEETSVDRLERHGDEITLIAGDEEIRAKTCVVAVGAWVAPLLEPLGIRIPVRVTREQVFYFRATDPIVPFIHRGPIARYGVPMRGRAPGVKIAEHMTGATTTPHDRSFDQDGAGAARVVEYVRAALPGLDPAPVAFESCLYTTTPDEGFVVEAFGSLVVASACSGHGFKFGSVIGEVIAHVLEGEQPESFSLRRFA